MHFNITLATVFAKGPLVEMSQLCHMSSEKGGNSSKTFKGFTEDVCYNLSLCQCHTMKTTSAKNNFTISVTIRTHRHKHI